ncbi:MAG: repair protein RecN [Bacteroidetes bacterium]|nr:repair protein RecN [Bacteroidota bacterium]
MLQHLRIENYALIRQMDISFENGFISITGETGAGKSIMLGALGLILGQRADTNVLWDKDKKCVVEAEFILDIKYSKLFDDNGLDFDETAIFRREISPNGKSRAFINDTPIQLSVMKEIGDLLMDIHSQHSTLTLKNSSFQFSVVDSFIKDKTLFNDYRLLFSEWKKLNSEIIDLEAKEADFLKESSYYQFLSEEFEKANLQIGEQEELEQEVELLSNAEEIKSSVVQTINILDNEDGLGALSLIQQVKGYVSKVAFHHKSLEDLLKRLDSSYIEIKDILNEFIDFNDSVVFDPNKLEISNERLDLIYRLEKKHNVKSIEELIEIRNDIDDKLLVTSNISDKIVLLKKEEKILYEKLTNLAKKITLSREEAKEIVSRSIMPLFADMGMSDAILKINILVNNELHINGENSIEFLFNANKGGELSPISKVISGGELSRLMLAIKAVEAQNISKEKSNLTIIFDEIDTGVSGDIASKVGNIMKIMSKKHQIIAITHLPQIAAKSDYHFKVYKKTADESTVSEMLLLNMDERINEIASMLSSDKVSDAAILNARELLS